MQAEYVLSCIRNKNFIDQLNISIYTKKHKGDTEFGFVFVGDFTKKKGVTFTETFYELSKIYSNIRLDLVGNTQKRKRT